MTVLSALPLIAYMIAQVTLRAGMFSGGRRNNKDNMEQRCLPSAQSRLQST
jgi:hypothetical protein